MKKSVVLSVFLLCLCIGGVSAENYSAVDMRSADTAILEEDM